MGVILTTYKSWDDLTSRDFPPKKWNRCLSHSAEDVKTSAGENLETGTKRTHQGETVKAEESDVVEKPTAPTPEEVTVHTTAFYEVKELLKTAMRLNKFQMDLFPSVAMNMKDDIVQYEEVLSCRVMIANMTWKMLYDKTCYKELPPFTQPYQASTVSNLHDDAEGTREGHKRL